MVWQAQLKKLYEIWKEREIKHLDMAEMYNHRFVAYIGVGVHFWCHEDKGSPMDLM